MKTPNNKFAKKTKRQFAFWLLIANCILLRRSPMIALLCVLHAFGVIGPTANSFSQDKPKEEFKPSGKLWGYAFGDFYYKMGGATAAGTDSLYIDKGDTTIKAKRWGNAEFAQKAKDYYAFTFRRIYFGYDYNLTPKLTAKILFEGGDGVLTPAGARTVYVKALFAEWKNILPKQNLLIGQFGTPAFATFTDPKWGYRSVEKTITDARGINRSNDLGIGMSGTIIDLKSTPADSTQKAKSLFNVSYNIMYGNGTAQKPEDANRMKVYYGEVILKLLNSIYIEGYAEYEPIDKGMYIGGPNSGKTYKTDKTTVKGFLGYEHERFMVGIETVTQLQKNGKEKIALDSATSAKKDTMDWKQMGLSFWARGTIVKDKLYAFARYDIFNNDANRRGWEYYNKDSDVKRYNETFLVIGLDWRPAKNFQVMPNLWLNSYKDMSSNVKDYTATGANAYKIENIKRDADVVPRITLFYKF